MSAIKFIKDHGVDKAREVVEGAPDWSTNFNSKIGYTKASNGGEYTVYKNQRTGNEDYSLHHEMGIDLEDLKRLVESVDLVEHFGNDLVGAKQLLEFSKGCKTIELSGYVITVERLEQAIADYEQLFGNTETLGGEHV